MDVAVVTVAYRSAPLYGEWLRALQRAWEEVEDLDRGQLRLILVDNSCDVSAATALRSIAPDIHLILPDGNRGFAAGCNLGLDHVPEGFDIILLNPDVRVASDFFLELARLEVPTDVAAVGPCVLGHDGKLEQSARRFPDWRTALAGRTSFLARAFPRSRAVRQQLLARPDGGARDVDWISGACMIISADRFERVGEFDIGYFMYWEDADWCYRASLLGLRVRYEPSLVVLHAQGSSSASTPTRASYHFHRSAFRYCRLHLFGGSRLAFAALLLSARFLLTTTARSAHRVKARSSRW